MARMWLQIRYWLMKVGEGSPYDFWLYIGKRIKYNTVIRYFSKLRKLGLIEVTRVVKSREVGFAKKYYRIVPGKENDERWHKPIKSV